MDTNELSYRIIRIAMEVHSALGPDLLVENKLVIEWKAVEALNDVHLAQVLTYLKLGKFNLGLLINFNVAHLKDGIKHVVNNFPSESSAQTLATFAVKS
jgi:hypothetical protein